MKPIDFARVYCSEVVGVLHSNCHGVYLYGSVVMGCFNPRKSDIDFYIILNNRPAQKQERELVRAHERLFPSRPFGKRFEAVFMTKAYATGNRFPTPFLFAVDTGNFKWAKKGECDEDFAIHRMHLRHSGVALHGPAAKKFFNPVAWKHIRQTIMWEIRDCKKLSLKWPVYVSANMCRAVYSLKTRDTVISKKGACEWALRNFPSELRRTISTALKCYTDFPTAARKRFLRANLPRLLAYCEDQI